jgi:hypothetical protein
MVKIYWVDESVCCWVDGPKEREKNVKGLQCSFIIVRYLTMTSEATCTVPIHLMPFE